jgi:two-component system, sensor histidine kinase LadS
MADLSQLTYLVVDDDRNTRKVMQVLLAKTGSSKVHIWESSESFENRLEALGQELDVVFLDIFIQPLSGYKMLHILHARPAYSRTLIIAMTARVMADDVALMKASGFDGLIAKPVIRQNFQNLLQSIVDGQSIWYIA